MKNGSKIKRRPSAYDRGQHELICRALKVSANPAAPGKTAYESVCELLYKIDLALQTKTLKEAKTKLRLKTGQLSVLPLYGSEQAS
jgi:hypothetical protein